MSAKTLLLAGAAVAAVATALVVGSGGGPGPSTAGRNASPQGTAAAQQEDAPAAAQLWGKPDTAAASSSLGTAALPGGKTAGQSSGATRVGADAGVVEPRTHREPARPRPAPGTAPAAAPATGNVSDIAKERHRPRGPKHRPDTPSSHTPASPPGRQQGTSLLGMQCDQMFPPSRQEFRVRNVACHRLLG
ncbi:hypothetical protein BKM31_11525 [[Actinomadura] parvosata subsp. kistnae]|uniref:Uncharacterized protein n=1 Tax=[Actinomadura] parvosata subsp. kistnae TaxID=1909395 RepID=A0A1U9ZVR4_9ACTN|nr:hypothetical protein BKM31_11525 [Nonomuraea sp. ATCC 55076]